MPEPERRELCWNRMLWEEGNNLTKVTSQGWSWRNKPQHLPCFLLTDEVSPDPRGPTAEVLVKAEDRVGPRNNHRGKGRCTLSTH